MSRILAPSVLSEGDKLKFITSLVNAGVEWIHYDVMDDTFLPFHSLPLVELEALIKNTPPHFVDVHLMVSNPRYYFERLVGKADLISFHLEAVDLGEAKLLIEHFSEVVKIGIDINPETPVEALKPLLNKISLVNVMTVNPGRGGQTIIHSALEKVTALREIAPAELLIQVDGGVNAQTLEQVLKHPVNVIVSGSYVASELKKGPQTLKTLMKQISGN